MEDPARSRLRARPQRTAAMASAKESREEAIENDIVEALFDLANADNLGRNSKAGNRNVKRRRMGSEEIKDEPAANHHTISLAGVDTRAQGATDLASNAGHNGYHGVIPGVNGASKAANFAIDPTALGKGGQGNANAQMWLNGWGNSFFGQQAHAAAAAAAAWPGFQQGQQTAQQQANQSQAQQPAHFPFPPAQIPPVQRSEQEQPSTSGANTQHPQQQQHQFNGSQAMQRPCKHCAAHVYIAHFIAYQQERSYQSSLFQQLQQRGQATAQNPYGAAAAGYQSLPGLPGFPYNLPGMPRAPQQMPQGDPSAAQNKVVSDQIPAGADAEGDANQNASAENNGNGNSNSDNPGENSNGETSGNDNGATENATVSPKEENGERPNSASGGSPSKQRSGPVENGVASPVKNEAETEVDAKSPLPNGANPALASAYQNIALAKCMPPGGAPPPVVGNGAGA